MPNHMLNSPIFAVLHQAFIFSKTSDNKTPSQYRQVFSYFYSFFVFHFQSSMVNTQVYQIAYHYKQLE